MAIQVTVWNEFIHERTDERVREIYPDGLHAVISDFLGRQPDIRARTATLDMPEHGLSESVLKQTDVLIWWGHCAHEQVNDEVVARTRRHVLEGMGLIVLHSGHDSKLFKSLMGTTCSLKWRDTGEKERLWNLAPRHPITDGISDYFEIPLAEMYGERFDIPAPDTLIFVSWFKGGEVFRSGCCWERGHGRIFYFKPGHETFPVFYQAEIQHVLINAVRWAKPAIRRQLGCPNTPPLER